MQPTADQRQYLLTDEQNQTLFNDIWSDNTDDSTPVTEPIALFLGGQPGSGKSGLAQHHLKQFADRGGVVLINSDALREYHPDFANLQRTDADRASFLVNPDTVIWQQKLIDAAITATRNLLLDGTLGGNPIPILATMQRLHSKGYTIRVSMLAVPAAQSRLGIYKRYENQVALKGLGRWVGMENHDRLFSEIAENLILLQRKSVVDYIQLYARPKGSAPPVLLYNNQRVVGSWNWQAEPLALTVLNKYRNQWLTRAERANHEVFTQQVRSQMQVRGASQEDIDTFLAVVKLSELRSRQATPADVNLYFAWANDPATRQQSFNSEPISWEQHQTWFTRKLADPDALLLVFETDDNVPVGQVRFEKQADDEVIIGISVAGAFRGNGLSTHLISDACRECRSQWNNVPVTAYIKPENQASVRAFERAGFVPSTESRKFEGTGICLVLEAV